MTLSAALELVRITEVWKKLGGGELRHGRGLAFWRGGDGRHVLLDDEKGMWCDHARSSKGGRTLALIETVLECDRQAAISWLAEAFSLEIDQARQLTPSEKRAYARARREAEQVAEWRDRTLNDLRLRRDYHLQTYHHALRCIMAHSLNHPLGNRWADGVEFHEPRYQALDEQIDAFLKAPLNELIAAFRGRHRRAA